MIFYSHRTDFRNLDHSYVWRKADKKIKSTHAGKKKKKGRNDDLLLTMHRKPLTDIYVTTLN